MTQRRRLLRIAWLLLLGCVVAGSLLPSCTPPMRVLEALNVGDKVWHFSAYFILMLLPGLHETRWVSALLALNSASVGVVLEFGQKLVTGRSFELADIAANIAGVLCGVVAGLLLQPRLATVLWSIRTRRSHSRAVNASQSPLKAAHLLRRT